jgi:hypothetical protein
LAKSKKWHSVANCLNFRGGEDFFPYTIGEAYYYI